MDLFTTRTPFRHPFTFEGRSRWLSTQCKRLWGFESLRGTDESVPDPDELPKDSELRLFLDDYQTQIQTPSSFEIFLETFSH